MYLINNFVHKIQIILIYIRWYYNHTLRIALNNIKFDLPVRSVGIIFIYGFHDKHSLHRFVKLGDQNTGLWEILKHRFLIVDIKNVNENLLERVSALATHVSGKDECLSTYLIF